MNIHNHDNKTTNIIIEIVIKKINIVIKTLIVMIAMNIVILTITGTNFY